jgi:hypothetical protein
MSPQRKRPTVQLHSELPRGAQMPKALSGKMLADPVVRIDRWKHHSFNRRVKAAAPNARASSAPLRGMLPQRIAILKNESMATQDRRNSC